MQVDLQKTEQAWQECCQHYVMTCILLPSVIVSIPCAVPERTAPAGPGCQLRCGWRRR